MLSNDECRRILGPEYAGNEEDLTSLKDALYGLARGLLEVYLEGVQASAGNASQGPIDLLSGVLGREDVETVEERAAIVEFDGGMDRDHAERLAISSVLGKLS